jgi:hypothetical protein
MTTAELRRLAAADPAAGLDPLPPADLLARLLAQPRQPARRSRVRGTRGVTAVAFAGALTVAGAALLFGSAGSHDLALTAKAYAQTGADGDQIVHTVTTTERTETTPAGERHDSGTLEEWHRGAQTHRLETFTKGGKAVALDQVIGADGVLRQVTDDGSYRVVRANDSDAGSVIPEEQAGFVADFRRRYEQGQLDRDGDTQFAGRPAERYLVSPGGAGLPGLEQAFYIDRETGAPLGYTSTTQIAVTDASGRSTMTTMRYMETVRSIERLDPTPENVRKLETLDLPAK